jgi:hypothetical protein
MILTRESYLSQMKGLIKKSGLTATSVVTVLKMSTMGGPLKHVMNLRGLARE